VAINRCEPNVMHRDLAVAVARVSTRYRSVRLQSDKSLTMVAYWSNVLIASLGGDSGFLGMLTIAAVLALGLGDISALSVSIRIPGRRRVVVTGQTASCCTPFPCVECTSRRVHI